MASASPLHAAKAVATRQSAAMADVNAASVVSVASHAGHFTVPRDFSTWHNVMPPEHITYFTRKGIKHLLGRHGLKVEKFFFTLKDGMRLLARKQG